MKKIGSYDDWFKSMLKSISTAELYDVFGLEWICQVPLDTLLLLFNPNSKESSLKTIMFYNYNMDEAPDDNNNQCQRWERSVHQFETNCLKLEKMCEEKLAKQIKTLKI